jgi:hypothetical protein
MYQQHADDSQHLHQYFEWTTKMLNKQNPFEDEYIHKIVSSSNAKEQKQMLRPLTLLNDIKLLDSPINTT